MCQQAFRIAFSVTSETCRIDDLPARPPSHSDSRKLDSLSFHVIIPKLENKFNLSAVAVERRVVVPRRQVVADDGGKILAPERTNDAMNFRRWFRINKS